MTTQTLSQQDAARIAARIEAAADALAGAVNALRLARDLEPVSMEPADDHITARDIRRAVKAAVLEFGMLDAYHAALDDEINGLAVDDYGRVGDEVAIGDAYTIPYAVRRIAAERVGWLHPELAERETRDVISPSEVDALVAELRRGGQ